MIPDDSVDLVFSFDSLVHAEADVMQAYLWQIARKLGPEGIGFLHHSNLGEYERHFRWARRIRRGRRTLSRLGLVEASDHLRAASMSAERFRGFAEASGLTCIVQEKVNWGSRRPIDCISVVTPRASRRAGPTRTLRNPRFMQEAARLARTRRLYAGPRP
jgi:hypothetical protein